MLPAVLAATAIAPPVAAAPVAPARPCAAPPTAAADARTAAADARACHVRVEVTSRRTEQAETYANPDGTYTMRISAVPQRVRLAGGAWAAIDTRLHRRADGTLAP